MTAQNTGLKLNYKQTFLIGFGFFASSLLWSLYNAFVPLLLQNFIASTSIIGAIMTIDNLFGVIFQPLFGSLSDRTTTKIGKRMPYIIVGAPLCALLFTLIPQMKSLGTMIFVLILFNFIMSTWRAPMITLMPDLTAPSLRSKANGIINLMGGIASIIAFLVGGKVADRFGTPYAFMMGSVVMFGGVLVLFLFVKEGKLLARQRSMHDRKIAEENAVLAMDSPAEEDEREVLAKQLGKKGRETGLRAFAALPKVQRRSLLFLLLAIFFWFCGYNATETFFTSFAVSELGMTQGAATFTLAFFSLAFVIFAVPAGFLGEKLGRKRIILLGLIGLVCASLPIFFLQNLLLIRILLIIAGLFWACININSLPMVLDLANQNQLGTFTGYYYFFSFSSSIVSPILFGFLRDLVSTYRLLFLYAACAYFLALLTMLRVNRNMSQE